MLSAAALACVLVAAPAAVTAAEWRVVSIEDYGAKGDNKTDNTAAFRSALKAVQAGGGEVLVPGPASRIFQTAPINLTSNVVLRVEGTMRASMYSPEQVEDKTKFPVIDVLPSVGHDYDTDGPTRFHPFVFAVDGSNITIAGEGTIDGAGAFWWGRASRNENHGIGRPHLLELHNISGAEVTGVTLLNSAFWTFHPVYCKDLHIHHMEIQVPWQSECCGSGFNGDGIDVDSCQNVLIEHNFINCGDDHVTVLSGVGVAGQTWNNGKGMPSKNITVRDNKLGSGMGLSIGSSVSGGVEDVTYTRNYMNETSGQWGLGIHIKTRTTYGGYIRNVVYDSNYFLTAGKPGGAMEIECGYQSGKPTGCGTATTPACTDIRDIVFRNLTFVNSGGTGGMNCFPNRPCHNITFDNVHIEDAKSGWGCQNIASGSWTDVTPPRSSSNSNCNFTTTY